MKLTAVDTEISRFNVAHWILKATPGSSTAPRAWMSRSVDGTLFLELDAQITASPGENVFYLPSQFGPTIAYLPSGYFVDTGRIYRSGDYLRAGDTFSDTWVRRMWSWFVPRSIRMTKNDLMISPPPRLSKFLAQVARLVRWSK